MAQNHNLHIISLGFYKLYRCDPSALRTSNWVRKNSQEEPNGGSLKCNKWHKIIEHNIITCGYCCLISEKCDMLSVFIYLSTHH